MPRRLRNSLGQFQDSWYLNDGPSGGCPTELQFLPAKLYPWKFRWHVKGTRRYVEADRGYLHKKRVRIYATTPEDAVAKVKAKEREIMQHGALAIALTSEQRFVAAQTIAITERLGVGPLDIVREFESTHPHGPNARTLDQVRVAVVEAKRKQGRSDLHLRSLDYRLRMLVEAIGDKPVTAITTKELQDEIERHAGSWSASTVHGVTQGWKIGLNYAIRQGWLVKNPANLLDLPKIVHEEPEILTVFEAKQLLGATLFRDRDPMLPECRGFLAIGMFAGLRPSEMQLLEWRHVDLDAATIRVTAGSAKDRDRRIVRMEPNLVAWLRPIARKGGAVLRYGLDKIHAAARAVLKLKEWPQDILRHTFASYHFGEWENEARTKKQMGHRDDGRIFYNHYCVPVAQQIARLFWQIFPPAGLLPCYTPGWAEVNPPAYMSVAS